MLDIKNIKLKTETEIMSSWTDTKEILVSVLCATFNHEDYVDDAIKSILMQKTKFCFEIIVRDDKSTDKTTNIIKQYVKKYPSIIKPIYEKENQFSKGYKPLATTIKKASGRFIALCEGDDYWTNPLKLAMQVDIFKSEPDISLCFHPAIEKNMLTNQEIIVCSHFSTNTYIKLKDVILGRGGYMPTASLMFKNQKINDMLESYLDAPIGDIFVQIFQSSLGKCYYLNEPMCLYRRNAKGSWTNSQQSSNSKLNYAHKMLEALDNFYGHIRHNKDSVFLHNVYYFYMRVAIRNLTQPISIIRKIYFFYTNIRKIKNLSIFRILLLSFFKTKK